MIYKKIPLREDDPDIDLTTYVSDLKGPARDAMLVIPGGGYYNVCADREGEPIALAYMNAGLNAFVLNYSVRERRYSPALFATLLSRSAISALMQKSLISTPTAYSR